VKIAFYFKSLITFLRISFFLLILSLNVKAQEGVNQRFFTSQNGLKITWVNSITKSQNNTFTIVHGPKVDLSKYDGYNFEYITSPSEIFGRTHEDFNGNLWSIDEGDLNDVFFYSNDKWQNLEFDAGIPFMPTPGVRNKLLFIRDGDLKEFDNAKLQTRIIKRAEESKIGQFIDMTVFQDGSVWITGEDGVAKYLVRCDTCNFQEQWIDFQVPKSYGLSHFKKPFEGEDGELTLISKSSKSKHNVLVGFNDKTWQELYVSKTDEVFYGWRGHDNSLWIIKGTQPPPPLNTTLRDWNLYHIQQGKETLVTKNRILNRILNDVVVEPNGAFWLATGSGLAHFTPTLWRRAGERFDLRQRIKKIHEDLTGRLWFAAEDSFFLWSNDKWESYQFNPALFTGDICSLKNGLLIVGISEEGGLALFNPLDKSCTVAFSFGNEKVRYYDQDKNGNCFIILQDVEEISRLIRYDGEHIETLAVDLKIDGLTPGACEVTDIIQARNKDVWIVTFTEVMVFKNGIKTSFDLKAAFEWGLSTSILELGNGNIWISGSNGIIQYDGENWSLVQSPAFETARMMTISRDSSIWVASGTGIHRLIDGTWVSNSSEEGLPNTTVFDVFEDSQGEIWAATLKGAYRYYPEADTDAPETVIPSDINSHEAIPSGDLQFVFKGHDKWDNTPDDRLQFSYRFDESSWSPFENITIVKGVGLSTGPHVFEVRAMDLNGNIDPSPASWAFTVMLPWYLETYFIILLVIAICMIIFSIGFAITRHRQVEKLVIIRTAELKKEKEKAENSEIELQKKNEEYETINEELNQTNEDLYKAKEKAEKSELELQTKNEEYETINEELIQTNEDLYKAKEKAEESDRLKSAFLANMSHEIRTPMNGILGFTDLLKEPNLTGDQQQKYIGIIEKGGARLINIINDIINISKIESGQIEVNRQESNINEQIEYIYTFFKPEIEAKGMQFSFKNSLPFTEAVLKTDREKVYAILTNLVKNAIKYSEKGSIEMGYVLKKDTEPVVAEQGPSIEVEFYVKDTGIGIPENRQEAIFERFIQADIEDKNAYQGAGLGLSISKAYVEMLGGKIWVESEEGIGSTFCFTLPYTSEKMKENNAQDEDLTPAEMPPVKKLKILIAEDDETSEELLLITVQKLGKEIISVKTGKDAVEACKNNPDIDLVLMDILMPEMNGYEATRQIREFNNDIIIIAQTAYALEGDKEKAMAAGCNDYLSKPINANEIKQMIIKYL